MADSSGDTSAADPATDEPAAPKKAALGPFSEPGVLQRAVCGSFAWAVTVGPAAFGHSGTVLSQLTAALAFAAALVGPALVPTRKRIGRHLGITAFLALATGTWLLAPQAIAIERLDLIRAGIGALAWGVFALSWGEPWRMREAPVQEEMGALLRARAQLPPLAVPLAGLGVVAALVVLTLGWRVREPSRALLAQGVSLVLAVALVTIGADIAVSRGRSRHAAPRGSVPKTAARGILMLVVFALLGGAILVMRAR